MIRSHLRYCLLFIVFALLFSRGVVTAQSADAQSVKSGAWSDASIWSTGKLPTTTDSVSISHIVTANVNSTIAGLTMRPGGELRFSPAQSVAISSTANVIVSGKLTMRPASPAIVHTLRFININEANFVGGGMDVLATDVGLWVMDGQLDIAGSAKTSWTRAAGSVSQGATTLALHPAPVGWQVGDEISIVPTEPPSVGNASWGGFDLRTVTAINGAVVSLSAPTTYAHPAVQNPFDKAIVYTAEVLNLSRNARIEGTGNGNAALAGNGRSHIFIRSAVPQSIAYLDIRHMGPRKVDGRSTLFVTGRYGLHFHHSMDGSRGSIVEGVVIRDTGSHAFVPHASHGITFRDTISYNVFEDAYWWDKPPCTNCGDDESINDTHDLLIDHAAAALVRIDPPFRGTRLTGFRLGTGNDFSLIVRNSVAVGVQGNKDCSGFHWPEAASAVWVFEKGNVAHNGKCDGSFVWQNNSDSHEIHNFVAYHNGGSGIDHGAYGNAYQYIDIDLFANGQSDIISRASSRASSRADGYGHAFERVRTTGTFVIGEHNLPYIVPTLVKDCILSGVTIDEADKRTPGQYDFVNCTKPDGSALEPTDFTIEFAWPTSLYRVQRPNGTSYQLTGAGVVTEIDAFYALEPALTPTPAATVTPEPTATHTPTPTATATATPVPLSELAETVRWILEHFPHVRQELINAGVIR